MISSLVIRLQEIKEDSKENLASPVISAVKNQFDCLDVKSKWNPRGIDNPFDSSVFY